MTSLKESFFKHKGLGINPLVEGLMDSPVKEGEGFDNNVADDFGDNVAPPPGIRPMSPSTLGDLINVAFDIYYDNMHLTGNASKEDLESFNQELSEWINLTIRNKNKIKIAYKALRKYAKYFSSFSKVVFGNTFTEWYLDNIENTAEFNIPL